jgi:sugar phosphate isomerase/epimerase
MTTAPTTNDRAAPRYAVNATSLPHTTVWQDIEVIAATGASGYGLWERKLPPGEDEAVVTAMTRQHLAASFCVPWSHAIVPSQIDPPNAPATLSARIDAICASIQRLAAFRPAAILVAPGASGNPAQPAGPRSDIVQALAPIADAAADSGVPIGLELLAARRGSAIPTLQAIVDVLDKVGKDNIGVMFSVFHSWDEPGLHEHLLRHADRINSVQVCDIRDPERSSFDRELPGRGRATAPGIMASLLTGGYRGWWELEIFSDDGTFGTALPGSYWAMPPADFLTQARAAFDSSYALATARAGVAGR